MDNFYMPKKEFYQVIDYLISIFDLKEMTEEERPVLFDICKINSLYYLKERQCYIEDNWNIRVFIVVKNEKSKKYYNINDDNEIYVTFDCNTERIESNCSTLLYELLIYRGIDSKDIEEKTEYYNEYIDILKTYREIIVCENKS